MWLSSHPSHKSLCFGSKLVIVVVVIDLMETRLMQRFTCDLYYCFGALLAPVSVGINTGKHYAKNSITKLNDKSNNGTCDPATRNCNKTEEPSEN